MSNRLKETLVILLIAALSGLVYLRLDDGGTADTENTRMARFRAGRPSRLPLQTKWISGKSKLSPGADRLLACWHGIRQPENGYNFDSKTYELATSSIKNLGCGDNLIALIERLTSEDNMIGDVFDDEIARLLTENSDFLQCKNIASIRSDPKLRLRWSYFFGRGCPSEELEAFGNLLSDSSDLDAARVGSLVRLSEQDPVAALQAAAEKMSATSAGVGRGEVLKDIIKAVSDITAFPSMEAKLRSIPEFPHSTEVGDVRDIFLEKWVFSDAASLAEHFNAYPEAMTARDASRAMERICRTDPAKAFEFAQHFDSPTHFDSAVMTIMPYVCTGYPEESMKLAQQLSLIEDRKYAVNLITNGLSNDINSHH